MALASRLFQRVVLIISSVVIAISLTVLGIFTFFPSLAEEFTAGLRPTLFYAPLPQDSLDPDLEQEYEQVIGVAHNSGDSVSATLAALYSGADAIEIDVVSLDGALYSSHASPLPWIGTGVFRGPRLEAVWTAAAQTDLVKFDLKESSSQFLHLVHEFLAIHRQQHQVVVATDDPASLRFLDDRMPDLLLFYSIGDRRDFETLQDDENLAALIDGVTIQHEVVDAETARWLNEHELRILAWTVNDIERANELIRLGVNGITTDNLALLSLFGGQRQGEDSLDQTEATPESGEAPTTIATPQRSGRSLAASTQARRQPGRTGIRASHAARMGRGSTRAHLQTASSEGNDVISTGAVRSTAQWRNLSRRWLQVRNSEAITHRPVGPRVSRGVHA